ncbi:hypothetical protein GCM10027076_21090 [Nocardioides montaniterrae]
MTIHVDHRELVAAAGGFDALAAELRRQDLVVWGDGLINTGSVDLDNALGRFHGSWNPGVVSIVDEQTRLARGLRDTVNDFLGVDVDVAYRHAVLERGLDLR